MDRTKEISLINAALASVTVQRNVIEACRKILRERINDLDIYDVILRDKALDIVMCIQFPIKEELKDVSVTNYANNHANKFSLVIKWILLAIVGLFMSFFPLWSILGGVFCLVSGYGLKSSFTSVPVSSSSSLVCTSTASELIEMIDVIFDKIQVLLNHNQLEGRHKDVLVWLQRLYSDSEDDKFEREILKLMSLLGYEFIEYNSGYSENFEVSSANVEEVVTAKYAVRNKSTGAFVLSGVVVFPK